MPPRSIPTSSNGIMVNMKVVARRKSSPSGPVGNCFATAALAGKLRNHGWRSRPDAGRQRGSGRRSSPERNRSVGIRVDLPFEQDVNPFVQEAW